MNILCRILALLILAVFGGYSQNPDVEIRVEDPNETRLPLGFLEFTPNRPSDPPLPVEIGEVVAADLDFSGRVRMIESLDWDSTTKKYFLHNEAYAFIHGEYQYDGARARIKCYLRDTESGDLIIGKNYEGNNRQLRKIAHSFADEIVYQLFGEKGIASTQILFISKTSGFKQAHIMDYDGADVQKITRDKVIHLFPCWLRNNKSIMYTSYKTGVPQLYTKVVPNGPEKMFISSRFLNLGCNYNNIDGEIVYTSSVRGNTEIFRISDSGENPQRLTFSKSLESDPSWSPNGYEIAFTSSRAGNPNVYVMDRDGSNIRRLTYEGKYNTSPAWSPRGDKIAFCSMGQNARMDIFTISPTGSQLRRLTANNGSNESPSWSPDGRALVFTSTRQGRKELYRMREDGSNKSQLRLLEIILTLNGLIF